EHEDRRGRRESEPRCDSACQARAHQTDAEANLAARRSRQKLAEGDDIAEGFLIEPAAAFDEFGAKISEMRDGTAKRHHAHAQERGEYLGEFRHAERVYSSNCMKPKSMCNCMWQ